MTKGVNATLVLDDLPVLEVSSKHYNVEVINSIDTKYKGFRQESKSP